MQRPGMHHIEKVKLWSPMRRACLGIAASKSHLACNPLPENTTTDGAGMRGGAHEGVRMLFLHWQLNFLLLSGATNSRDMWHESKALARVLSQISKQSERV